MEYLDECKDIENNEDKINCLDVYYSNNIRILSEKMEECENGNCDPYYFEAANYAGTVYCDSIESVEMRRECLGGE
jgi:hypothetical protein